MTGFVYAIGDAERVKIGYSANPSQRFSKLQTDSAVRCEIIGTVLATMNQERELHRLLAAYRLHREWFRREGAVAAFCDAIAGRGVPAARHKISARNGVRHPLRAYRVEQQISLQALADAVGVTKPTMSRIERGKQKPSLDLIDRLVSETGGAVTADDFLPSRRGA